MNRFSMASSLSNHELLLEPNSNPAAHVYQKALFEQGIAATAFRVDDVQKEYAKLKALGVEFTMTPVVISSRFIK